MSKPIKNEVEATKGGGFARLVSRYKQKVTFGPSWFVTTKPGKKKKPKRAK